MTPKQRLSDSYLRLLTEGLLSPLCDQKFRRGTLRQAALFHLARLYPVLWRSRFCRFGLFLFSAAPGGHCCRSLPTSFPAGRPIHSRAFAQAQPGPPLIARSASSSSHRLGEADAPTRRSLRVARLSHFVRWQAPLALLRHLRCLDRTPLRSPRRAPRLSHARRTEL